MDVFSKDKGVSKDEFLYMIENLDVGFYKGDLDGKFLMHNRILNEILGFDPSKDLTGSRTDHFFKNKADQKKIFRKLMEMGRVKNYVVQVKKQNGKIITVQINAHVVKEFDDKLTTIEGIVMDISEKYQLEQRLKESEKSLAKAQEIGNFGSWEWDISQNTTKWSNNLYRIFGVSPEFFDPNAYEHFMNLIHSDDQEFVSKTIKQTTIDGNIFEIEYRIARPDNMIRYILAKGKLSDDGKLLRGTSQDITERKKEEQKLKESEARYKILSNELETILDLIPGILFCKDRNDVVTRVNQNFADLLNLKKEDIIGKTTFDLFPKDQAEVFRKDDLEVINTGKPKLNIEEVADFPGKKIWSTTSKVPYYNDKGEIDGIIGLAFDISERKKIEQELKESEEKYSNLFQYSNDAIIIHDFEGNILEVNDRAIELFKYPKEEFLALTTPMLRTIEEQETGEKVSEEISKKGFVRFEFYFKRKDGTVFPAEVSSRAIEIQGKKSIQAVIRDITDRKDSEERLKIFMESAPNTFMLYDSDLNLIDINKIGIKRFPAGTKKEDIIGKNIVDLSPDVKNKGRYDEYMEVIKTGKPFFVEEFIPHPKFGNLHISLNAFKVLNGLGIIARDITESKKTEQKLKESEKKLKMIFENANDAISIHDLRGNFYTVNKTYCERLGYTKEELLKLTNKDLNTPEFADLVASRVLEVKEKGFGFFEGAHKAKDGRVIPVEISARRIHYDNKLSILSIIRDITERKKVEQKLIEVNKLKSEFLRRASHELKTPLISIKGFSELILALHEDQLELSIISKLREINDGCERLQNIINNLLKASRLESPELKPQFQKEDLSFLIKFCVHELESLAERRNQSIKLDIHSELYANIEKEEIHDVLSNLLTNAIKYTPPRGKIEIKTELKEDSVVVLVSDNGIGFTEEQKKKIFQQFGKIERYGQGLDLGIDGTGLGLYISKRIVESHGGKIWMESEGKSRGSTFYFNLPTVKK